MKTWKFETILVVMLLLLLTGGCKPDQAAYPETGYPYTPVPFTDVKIDGGFWLPRIETNRDVTLWYEFGKCEETGRIDNFAVAGGLKEGGFTGIYFNDSDVYKVIEGAAYTIMMSDEPDEQLEKYLDDLISKIAAAQENDGYLYTARTIGDHSYDYPGKEARWSHLGHGHELYNAGHLYEAAVAHYQATGRRDLLDIAVKNAYLVCKVFGPGEGQMVAVPGHEEIEIGLVRLYRATGDRKYFEMAKFFIDMRGRKDLRELYGEYAQDHLPLREQATAVGHAVRGGYFYSGMADVASITGDQKYIDATDRIWNDVVNRKLYITGNVGQHGAGEGYAGAYLLDNLKAYNETCAAIALAMWNHRMFLLKGDSKYVDVLERTIYNGFLSGIALSGDRFFYPNPLECDMQFRFNHGNLERSPWFDCSCCPVNIVRFIPSIPGYLYAAKGNDIYVNLYTNNTASILVAGNEVKLVQRTRYPWEGNISIGVEPERPEVFSIMLRIPGWAQGRVMPGKLYEYVNDGPADWEVRVNGKKLEDVRIDPSGYVEIKRRWKKGDRIELNLPMEVRMVKADPRIESNFGRLALERGPLVYCVEGADNDGRVLDLELDTNTGVRSEFRENLLGGVTVLTAGGRRFVEQGESRPAEITLVPYFAWCNRGANEMAVWLKSSSKMTPVRRLK